MPEGAAEFGTGWIQGYTAGTQNAADGGAGNLKITLIRARMTVVAASGQPGRRHDRRFPPRQA